MEPQTYIEQISDYRDKFVDWLCKPYEKFNKDYERKNRSLLSRLIPIRIETGESMDKFNRAAKQFEKEIRQRYDLIAEIFDFFDKNHDVYIQANETQRDEIRSLIGNTYYEGPGSGIVHYLGNYMATLLSNYVMEHVVPEFKRTGDEIWMTRGLVAISMENCCLDFRETITCLSKLYVAAERKGLNPETAFQKIAEISSKKLPKGGDSSVSSMMATTGSYAATAYERTMQ